MAYKTFADLDVLTGPDVMTYLMDQVVITCTSGTRPGSPVEGMTIWETDTKSMRVYSSSAWRRTSVFDVENVGHGADSNTSTISSITSTTPAAGSPACGDDFIAPPSGGVYVTISGRIQQNNNGAEILLGFELRTGSTVGSGTVTVSTSSVRALTAGRGVTAGGVDLMNASRRYRIQPGTLTAGAAYNVRTMHWVDGGSGQIEHREIIVEPVL